MVKFEWDAEKAASNLKKHGVSFDSAQSVFYDEFAIQFSMKTTLILKTDF